MKSRAALQGLDVGDIRTRLLEGDLAALLRERDTCRQERRGDEQQPLNHDS